MPGESELLLTVTNIANSIDIYKANNLILISRLH